jgi:DNA-binding beta-propeller fold protein YncE
VFGLSDWDGLNKVETLPVPEPPGTLQSTTASGLTPGASYFFAIRARDEASNWSSVSNLAPSATFPEAIPEFVLEWGGFGSGDGQFNSPFGIGVDQSSNVFVVDTNNHRVQKFDNNGTFLTKWGHESAEWIRLFRLPSDVAIDSKGAIYVSDFGATTSHLRKLDPSGKVLRSWGQGIGDPMGVAVDAQDNLYVVDYLRRTVYKFDENGLELTRWGSSGTGDGEFNRPRGIAVDHLGSIYVADTDNNRIQKFTNDGEFVLSWGELGSDDGQFDYPRAIAAGTQGFVFVADTRNYRVQKFDTDGGFISSWGSEGRGDGQFLGVYGIEVDDLGNVYTSDSAIGRIQKFTGDGVFLGAFGRSGWSEGEFNVPWGLDIDPVGNLHIADRSNGRVQKFSDAFEFLESWQVQPLEDGAFSGPKGIAIDQSGVVYVGDTRNRRIQKFTNNGIFTKKWSMKVGVRPAAMTAHGDVLYVISLNEWGHYEYGLDGQSIGYRYPSGYLRGESDIRIAQGWRAVLHSSEPYLEISKQGHVTYAWGKTGVAPGLLAGAAGLALDDLGNVYVADTRNDRIQKFRLDGTFLNTWGAFGSGPGQFNNPTMIAVADDAIFVVDSGNNRIQKFLVVK